MLDEAQRGKSRLPEESWSPRSFGDQEIQHRNPSKFSRRLEKAFVTSRLDKTGAEFPISRKFQFYRSSLARDFFLFRFGWEKREKQIDLIRVTTNIPPRYFLGLGDSRFNWLSRLSIIPRNKYTNIAVPNSSEIPSLGPLQTATLSRFSVLSSDGFPPF